MADIRVPEGSHRTHRLSDGEPGTAALVGHAAHRGGFLRHLAEMVVAMWVGMAVGALIWSPILRAMGMTASEARIRYPELFVLVMVVDMTIPMVAWMRHRGHSWRACAEMSGAMAVPAVLALGGYWLGVTGGPACGLICTLMIPAMAIAMLLRRDEYGL